MVLDLADSRAFAGVQAKAVRALRLVEHGGLQGGDAGKDRLLLNGGEELLRKGGVDAEAGPLPPVAVAVEQFPGAGCLLRVGEVAEGRAEAGDMGLDVVAGGEDGAERVEPGGSPPSARMGGWRSSSGRGRLARRAS